MMTLLNFSSERTLTFLESLSVFLLRTIPNLLSVECLRAMPLVCTSVFPSLLFDNKDSLHMTLYRAAERSLETHWMLRGSNISGGMMGGRKRERSIPLLPLLLPFNCPSPLLSLSAHSLHAVLHFPSTRTLPFHPFYVYFDLPISIISTRFFFIDPCLWLALILIVKRCLFLSSNSQAHNSIYFPLS